MPDTINQPPKPGITVVLNTYNASRYLQQVLEAASAFDETVIADMHSTDRTVEIAAPYAARIIEVPRSGICETARNDAIALATHEWVLVIDADELVTPSLKEALYAHIASPAPAEGLRLPRRNFFMDREMHCLYPDYVLRFAKRDSIYWPPVIHSVPRIQGRVADIPSCRKDLALVHLEKNTISSRLEKIDRYTDREVERRGYRDYTPMQRLLKPAARFIRSYVFKGGWRDGKAGLQWARLEALYKKTTMRKQERK